MRLSYREREAMMGSTDLSGMHISQISHEVVLNQSFSNRLVWSCWLPFLNWKHKSTQITIVGQFPDFLVLLLLLIMLFLCPMSEVTMASWGTDCGCKVKGSGWGKEVILIHQQHQSKCIREQSLRWKLMPEFIKPVLLLLLLLSAMQCIPTRLWLGRVRERGRQVSRLSCETGKPMIWGEFEWSCFWQSLLYRIWDITFLSEKQNREPTAKMSRDSGKGILGSMVEMREEWLRPPDACEALHLWCERKRQDSEHETKRNQNEVCMYFIFAWLFFSLKLCVFVLLKPNGKSIPCEGSFVLLY